MPEPMADAIQRDTVAAQPFAKLTPRHREVLSLLATRQMESKEIARELGIEKSTVDGYFREINRLLGVARRRDAARLYAGFAGLATPPHSVSPHLVRLSDDDTRSHDAPVDWNVDRRSRERVAEVATMSWNEVPVRPWWGRRNDLTVLQRALAIVILALAVMVAAALVIPVTDGIQRMAERLTTTR